MLLSNIVVLSCRWRTSPNRPRGKQQTTRLSSEPCSTGPSKTHNTYFLGRHLPRIGTYSSSRRRHFGFFCLLLHQIVIFDRWRKRDGIVY
jgi:hypothetical protein